MQKHRETQLKLVSSHFPSNTVVERSEIDDEVDSFIESEHDPYYGRYQQHMQSKALSTAQYKIYICLRFYLRKFFRHLKKFCSSFEKHHQVKVKQT